MSPVRSVTYVSGRTLALRELLSDASIPQKFNFAASYTPLLSLVFYPAACSFTDASEEQYDFYFNTIIAPIVGIAITKIAVKALKQRTIVFKLILMLVNLFRSVSDIRRNVRNEDAER